MIGYEGNNFANTGDIEKDLLSITSVHPMREEAVKKFLSNTNFELISKMVKENKLVRIKYNGKKFYLRKY